MCLCFVQNSQYRAACAMERSNETPVLSYTQKCIQNTKYLTKGMDNAKKAPSGQQTINSVFYFSVFFFLFFFVSSFYIVDDGRSGIVIKSLRMG